VLIDPVLAEAARGVVPVEALGARPIKGYDSPLSVFAVRSDSFRTAP
jgi:class 3 adenylate cyclase